VWKLHSFRYEAQRNSGRSGAGQNRIGNKHLEGLAYHLPVVGVGFVFQLFKVIAGKTLGQLRLEDVVPVQISTGPCDDKYEKRYKARDDSSHPQSAQPINWIDVFLGAS
jgi:hypothetical protein